MRNDLLKKYKLHSKEGGGRNESAPVKQGGWRKMQAAQLKIMRQKGQRAVGAREIQQQTGRAERSDFRA